MQEKAEKAPTKYDETMLLAQIDRLAKRGISLERTLSLITDLLHRGFPHYDWVGVYGLEGEELVLRGWTGPRATEHVRIPIGQGICGLAARTGETVNVPDVNADPRYLACFPTTRSEIVVPIKDDEGVYGEIDVDSDRPAAFSEQDQRFLEAAAERLVPLLKRWLQPEEA